MEDRKRLEIKLIYSAVWVVASAALLAVVWFCTRGDVAWFAGVASGLFLTKMIQEGWAAGERKAKSLEPPPHA